MANVQLENGYTEIANELLTALSKIKLNGTQFRLINCILRYTYGFKRKTHKMSNGFISKGTGINEKQVNRELSSLIEKNIIIVAFKGDYTNSREIGINKDYSSWKCFDKDSSSYLEGSNSLEGSSYLEGSSSSGLEKKVPSNQLPKKQTINKENIKETHTSEFEEFYSIYPNTVNKELTYRNYLKAIKKDSAAIILQATKNYISNIESKNIDKQYIFKSTNFIGQHAEYKNYIDYEEVKTIPIDPWENMSS